MAITPGTYNMTVQRRADHSIQLVFKDNNDTAINLTGFTVAAQVWDEPRSNKYADFAVTLRDSWANLHYAKDTTAEHSHSDGWSGNTHISGVYYLRKPSQEGHIHMCDPMDYVKRLTPMKEMYGIETISQEVECQQYDFILFPSWARHRVPSFTVNEERIAISFNYIGYEKI